MPQLRTRIPKSNRPIKKTTKKSKIIQTFIAKDNDVKTTRIYPRTQKERMEYINPKTGKRITPFQYKVYDLVSKIPSGQVTSYKALSDALSSSPRAVGQALRVNPFCPLPIPCHRVITSGHELGGFSGGSGNCQLTADKKAKLEAEGCVFDAHYGYKHDINGTKDFFKPTMHDIIY